MPSYPRVALLIESSRTYGRGVLRGIARYAHVHGPWSIFSQERELQSGNPGWLKKWWGDGVIARIENRAMARDLLRLKIPVVDVLGNGTYESILGFDTDAEAVAKMAADFFVKANFRNIAYCGYRGIPFSDRREAAMAAYLARMGRTLLVCPAEGSPRATTHIQATEEAGVAGEKAIANWLRKQGRPLALFACNDVRAQQVLNACREHGIRVPEDIAVMGVDNDDVLCNLSEPPLTSIQPDTERLGHEAAALLDRLMRGKEGTTKGVRQIPPLGIVERGSTDMVAVEDPLVVRALRFIRDNLGRGIVVKDVLEEVGRSRTDLENRFRRHLQTSVRKEILRQKLDRAGDLLRQTDLRIEDIAARSGFSTATHFCRLFQTHLQTTPTRYRQSSRPG